MIRGGLILKRRRCLLLRNPNISFSFLVVEGVRFRDSKCSRIKDTLRLSYPYLPTHILKLFGYKNFNRLSPKLSSSNCFFGQMRSKASNPDLGFRLPSYFRRLDRGIHGAKGIYNYLSNLLKPSQSFDGSRGQAAGSRKEVLAVLTCDNLNFSVKA